MAEYSSWPTRTRGFGKYLNLGHPYCCWCPCVTGYQHPKCWLRVCYTKTVSYMMRYWVFLSENHEGLKSNLVENGLFVKGSKDCNWSLSHAYHFKTISILHMICCPVLKHIKLIPGNLIFAKTKTDNKTVQFTEWIWILCSTKIDTFFLKQGWCVAYTVILCDCWIIRAPHPPPPKGWCDAYTVIFWGDCWIIRAPPILPVNHCIPPCLITVPWQFLPK